MAFGGYAVRAMEQTYTIFVFTWTYLKFRLFSVKHVI